MHEWNDSLTEKFQIRDEVEEVDLNAVAARPLEPNEPIDDLFGRPDQMDVAANHPLIAGRLLPRRLIAAGKRGVKIVRSYRVLMIKNRLVLRPSLFLGVPTDNMRIDYGADRAAPLLGCSFYVGIVRRQGLAGLDRVGACRAGYEDKIRMANGVCKSSSRRSRIDKNAAAVDRLRRNKGVFGLPKPAVDREFLVFEPKPLQNGRELIRHFIAKIVLLRLETEHLELALFI